MSLPDLNSFPGMYSYKHLPALAKFILNEHLQDFAHEQLILSRQYNVPLLKLLSHYSDAELIDISIKSITEILGFLKDNKASEQIESSLQKWITNQLNVVGKYDIVAEDITLVNYVRGKNLKNFAYKFYNDIEKRAQLLGEIDDYLLAAGTAAINTYIQILKDRISDEEEFRVRLSDALPGFIYVYDVKENKQVYSNDKLKDILGYSENKLKELEKDSFKSIIHPNDWTNWFGGRESNRIPKGSVNSYEVRIKDSADNYRWIRNYETDLRRQQNGDIVEIIGVVFDVTGEKEITEALATREAQLLEAQNTAHIGSFEWNIIGEKSTTNTPEIYNIFELGEMERFEEFIKHVYKDDVEKVQNALKESFKTGDYECDYRYIRNGKEKIIWSKGVVTIVDGVAVKMAGTVQDITAIKSMEAELKEKTIELEESNERLRQFASIASHDLKEPLRKISLFGSRILEQEKDNLSEISKSALSKIFDSAGRMQKMIEDILEFSFVDGSQEKQPTDLEQILAEVKDLLSENIADKKAEIISDGLPVAFVIESQIRQLFQNLVANALKFAKEHKSPVIKITHAFINDKLTVAAVKKQLKLSIEDNGIGFDKKDHEKIFSLFYRVHNRSKFEGNGLGLSICKKIVENHHGEISANSTPGVGSVFTIILPA